MSARHAAGIAVALGAALAASQAAAQGAFRCTAPDGAVTYQQAPCPKASEERKVDTTPANTDFDPKGREQLLKQGEEAGKRLEARAAEEEAQRRRRAEQRAKEEKREREAQAREEARDNPQYIYAWPAGTPRPPNFPWPHQPNSRPMPRSNPTPGR